MHRNLYLPPRSDDPNNHTCPLCGAHQNQFHLVDCPAIENDLWLPLTDLTWKLGFPKPEHLPSYLVVGRLSRREVVDKNHSGILFTAWRCLYAELISARLDNKTPNITNAYIRTLTLTHTRLVAYGERWLKWVRKNRETNHKSYIPTRHQDKKIINQDGDGNYRINALLYREIDRLRT